MARKLKIGLVIDDSLDRPDGVQQYVLAVGEWLRGRGHDVHYLAGQTVRQDIPNLHSLSRNITVRFNGNGLSIPLPASGRALRRLLQEQQFDVLHVQMPYSPMLAHKLVLRSPRGTAIFGTFHILPQSGLVNLATRLLGCWLRRSLRRFSQVYAVSPSARDFACRAFRLPADSVSVLPNVVNLRAFDVPAAGTAAGGDGAGGPVVLFLGRLVPRKGCGTFLEAVAGLRRQYGQPFTAIVCGKGPLLADLQAQAKRLGIDDITRFAGFVPEADKPALLASAAIAAYPSTGGESFGIVLLEAMAAGQRAAGPVVLAARNPGYATVLEPRPELLFAPGDQRALAASMLHYLEDASAADRVRRWQQTYVRQFDVDVVGQRLLAAYQAHLRQPARP